MSEGWGRWGSGWGLGAVSEGVGWGEWARLAPRTLVSSGWGQLRKGELRPGLNVTVGRVSGLGGGGQRLAESGLKGGIRARQLCDERTEEGRREEVRARV